jgi:hypothetical protein
MEVNIGARSDTIECGIPWRCTISVKNALTTDTTEYGWVRGMKWQYFLKKSTIKMTDFPRM